MPFPNLDLTFKDALGTRTVRIFVGTEGECYVVHTNLLISLSDYVLNALTSVNDQGEEEFVDSYEMPEEDPVVFSLLVEWLYRGTFPDPEHQKPVPTRRSRKKAEKLPPMDDCHYPAWVQKELPNSNLMDRFIHICFQPSFRTDSPEEIRLQYYKSGRRFQVVSSPLPPISNSNISEASPLSLAQQEVVSLESLDGLQPNTTAASPVSNLSCGSQNREVAGPLFQGLAASGSESASVVAFSGLFGTGASFIEKQTQNSTKSSPPTRTSASFDRWSGIVPQKPVSNHSNLFSTSSSSTSISPSTSPTSSSIILAPNQAQTSQKSLQLALIHLCLLATKLECPALFNDTVKAYIQGECKHNRSIPLEHVKLIYNSTVLNSSLRQVAIDSIVRFESGQSPVVYLPFANENSIFLSDLMTKVFRGLAQISSAPDEMEFEKYYMKDEK